ncbi:transposase [Streptomyces sp. NPDC021012]|uniref:transposase n=1 Tax=Streptomyces sp. NPDC021012 TaxID=3365107 RepID=UPI00378F491A
MRGGFTTKIHLACEQGQEPLPLLVTAGQRADSPQFEPVLEAIQVPRTGPGRPKSRPLRVRGSKAYSSRANRAYLRRRGVRCTIPEPAGQVRNRKRRGRGGGRPPALDGRTTRPGTRPNEGSADSSGTARSPPAMTGSRFGSRQPSTSRQSVSGCGPARGHGRAMPAPDFEQHTQGEGLWTPSTTARTARTATTSTTRPKTSCSC